MSGFSFIDLMSNGEMFGLSLGNLLAANISVYNTPTPPSPWTRQRNPLWESPTIGASATGGQTDKLRIFKESVVSN